ncbi:MAG: serine hydrolase domain-containing protein [Pseudomonadota bacterium]
MKTSLAWTMALAAATAHPSPLQAETVPEAKAAAEYGMEATGAEGLAYAVVRDGEIAEVKALGVRNEKRDPLTPGTVMYGASLTKTVFAYFILKLQDQGRIDLDQTIDTLLPRPLPSYVGFERTHSRWGDLADDDRWKSITPRMLLTHSGGFRNFYFITPDGEFDPEGTLDIYFEPGTRYFYSGDGFILLQFALEQGLDMDVGEEMRRQVFQPLGMTKTDMMWRDDFAENLADGFTVEGQSVPHDDRSKVRAAGSMDTTISDMAKFAAALAKCEGLSESSCAEFFAPTLPIPTATQFMNVGAPLPDEPTYPDLAAGLGLVVTSGPQGKAIFKGGHNGNTGNTMVCLPENRDCIVILSNDVRAEAAFPMIVESALGDTGVPWKWEYPRLDFVEQ